MRRPDSLFPNAVPRAYAEGLEAGPVVLVKLGRRVLQPAVGNELERPVEVGGVPVHGPQVHGQAGLGRHNSPGDHDALATRGAE